MCGISGIFSRDKKFLSRENVEDMNSTQRARGPDGEGVYVDEFVVLGHTRLAINSSITDGIQPMVDEITKNSVVFNGEIYNHQKLRTQLMLLGEKFNGQSDTEVLLRGLNRFGLEFVQKIDGDFAFAFWNSDTKQLLLCRDRLGIKPLYYLKVGSTLFFASEIKALQKWSSKEISPIGLENFFAFRYTRGEHTLWSDIKKVLPGSALVFDLNLGVNIISYWQMYKNNLADFQPADFLSSFKESCELRAISTLKVGLFSSGGIDSAFIARLTANHLAESFTYQMPGEIDDVQNAKQLAEELGLSNIIVNEKENWFESLGTILKCLDDPIADSILYPTYRLCHEAKKKVSIALSGEGADELFASYGHQNIIRLLLRLRAFFGKAILKRLTKILNILPLHFFPLHLFYPASMDLSLRLRLIKLIQNCDDIVHVYHITTSLWSEEERRKLLRCSIGDAPLIAQSKQYLEQSGANKRVEFEQIRALDLGFWLPDYGLKRLDSLSMSLGLELRLPYLSHMLVEASVSAGPSTYADNKTFLREAIAKSGSSFWKRKKNPFTFPLKDNVNNNFFEFSRKILNDDSIKRHHILNSCFVSDWLRGYNHSVLHSKKLFSLVVFQMWCEENL